MGRLSKCQIDFIREKYQSMNARDVATQFNVAFGSDKTQGQMISTIKNHGITCGRKGKTMLKKRTSKFTEDQERFIRENYRHLSRTDLAKKFNEFFETDFRKTQIVAFTKNHKIRSGRTGRFDPGHEPWTKSVKGMGIIKPNAGSFKKGMMPPNTRPVGSERVNTQDGCLLVKIVERNPYTNTVTRFKHKHVHVWEQTHGPVPKGMAVIFKDSNPLNTNIENLELVSKAELLRLNKNGYRKFPEELKPSVFAISKLETKTFEVARKR